MKINLNSCITEEAELSNYDLNTTNKLILVSNYECGFYENIPVEASNLHKNHFFLITKTANLCFADESIRIITYYNKLNNKKLRAYPGHLTFQNIEKGCIRFHEKDLIDLLNLLKIFEESGNNFLENKKIDTFKTKIEYKRFIEMEQTDNCCLYNDINIDNTFYIELEKLYNYEDYKKLISYIQNTQNIKSFDTKFVYALTSNYDLKCYIMIKNNCFEKKEIEEFTKMIKKDEILF